jgi:D-alanyl-D-alanine carboxypeptidase/D-alanyl-D-alanine-endopeptidase (penicillin-binding protein 4)
MFWLARMARILFGIAACLALVESRAPAQLAAAAAPTDTLASLQERLHGHLSQPRFAAAVWGLKVVSLDSGRTIFEHNAGKLLKPASNAKLYTGALALDRLGPDYRIQTSLYSNARPNRMGTLAGDLIIYGRGDPSWAARFHDGDYTKGLDPLVQAVVDAGVKRIKGDLIGDESFFRGPPLGSGWMWDDLQFYYGAEVSALTVQDNVVDLVFKPGARVGEPCQVVATPATRYLTFINRTETVSAGGARALADPYRPLGQNVVYLSGTWPLDATNRTDAVSVHDPARWFVTLFREALGGRGIAVSGQLRTLNWLDRQTSSVPESKRVELGSVGSCPLSEIVTRMMKPSQNLYAQLLLLQVGARRQTTEASRQTTEEAGLEEMNQFLGEAGVRKGDVFLEEGSGLSRGALVTPNATVALLQFMYRHRHAAVFRDALPVAGVDGTLKQRLKQAVTAGKVRAKTGYIGFVHTISGYATTAAGEQVAFSIMLNNYRSAPGQPSGRDDVDALVVMLAGFTGRTL